MRTNCLLIGMLLACIGTRAQKVIDVNTTNFAVADPVQMNSSVNGLIYSPVKFVRVVSGTPFFRDEYMSGAIIFPGGKAYKGFKLRLNLLDNQVNYLNDKGQELIATTPLAGIILGDSAKGESYVFVPGDQLGAGDNNLNKVWFEILINDRVSLCLQMRKTLHDQLSYGSATTQQDILTDNFYFIRKGNDFIRIKKWDELVELFADKKAAVTEYIKTNHLKGKNQQDYTQLVKYYNTL